MQDDREDRDLPIGLIVIAVGAAAAVAYYYWIHTERQAAEQKAPPVAEAPAPEPKIRYPIQTPPVEAAKPLPPLAESDAPLQEALAGLIDKDSLKRFFHLDSIVRRFVVTIEELPRKKMSQKYQTAKPVGGKFQTAGKDDNLAINPENYKRYTPYVQLAETIDTAKLVATYKYFYPLFQEEYKNLGYPRQYFNDRVVDVIDDMLAAPELKASPKLVQPKVFYQYADPKLEELSAGQKIIIRMGPENAARMKAKLQEIRREITGVR